LEDVLEYIGDNIVSDTDNEITKGKKNRETIISELKKDLAEGNFSREFRIKMFENHLYKEAYDSYFTSLVNLNRANAVSKIYLDQEYSEEVEKLFLELGSYFSDNPTQINQEKIDKSLDDINSIIHRIARIAHADLDNHFE